MASGKGRGPGGIGTQHRDLWMARLDPILDPSDVAMIEFEDEQQFAAAQGRRLGHDVAIGQPGLQPADEGAEVERSDVSEARTALTAKDGQSGLFTPRMGQRHQSALH